MSTTGGFWWKSVKVVAGLGLAAGILTAFAGLDRGANLVQSFAGMFGQGVGITIGSVDDGVAGLDQGLIASGGTNGAQKSSNFPGISGFDKVPPKHTPHKAAPTKP